MKNLFIAFFLLMFSSLNSQNLYEVSKGEINFSSDAVMELIEANSEKLTGLLRIDNRSFAFRVLISSFKGFNSSLQQTHFNENYMESSKYPFAIFEGKIIDEIDLTKQGSYIVKGKGMFTCHGIEKERIIVCKISVTESEIKINSSFQILLEDHDIKIPTIVYQKVAEVITADIDVILKVKK